MISAAGGGTACINPSPRRCPAPGRRRRVRRGQPATQGLQGFRAGIQIHQAGAGRRGAHHHGVQPVGAQFVLVPKHELNPALTA